MGMPFDAVRMAQKHVGEKKRHTVDDQHGWALLFVVVLLGGIVAAVLTRWLGWAIAGGVGLYFLIAVKVADQWEKAAVLRLGGYQGLCGPGLFMRIIRRRCSCAPNMLYEAIKEKGSMVIVPSSAVEAMGLGGVIGTTALARPSV